MQVPSFLTPLVRDEHHFDGDAGFPCSEALDLLTAFVRTAKVAPVAWMQTVRRVVAVLGTGGRRLAEIDDDVTVHDGGGGAAKAPSWACRSRA